ncbi:MAG: hypothetical protein HY777_05310 [Betaproteobacteria bacterium]|nr:hypothetical protein [Betaproteobacteria bacterium]
MTAYDPAQSPDPQEWLQLDEQERIMLIEGYHESHGVELPSLKVHAIMHAIVENQLAEADDPVVRALARLVKQGLARHEAVHAIASVVAEHVFDLLEPKGGASSVNVRYHAQVERLDAAQWWNGAL